MQSLRERIGDTFLQDYFTQERGKIAARTGFFRVLDEHTNADYPDIVKSYLK